MGQAFRREWKKRQQPHRRWDYNRTRVEEEQCGDEELCRLGLRLKLTDCEFGTSFAITVELSYSTEWLFGLSGEKEGKRAGGATPWPP